jgi:ribulose-phosphate 3-epimerase
MERLTLDKLKIWPSLLAANLLHLSKELEVLEKHGIQQIHLDVMDNHYVPNLTFGPDFCHQIHHQFPKFQIDVHLMVTPVNDMIIKFAKAGAKRIAIHADASLHLNHSLDLIRQNNCFAGLAINPGESVEHLKWCHQQLDYILIMTVNPGFGGQKLIPSVMEKIQFIKNKYPDLPIMVDGGVNQDNILDLIKCGAEEFVIGSALFQASNYPACIGNYSEVIKKYVL